MILKLFFAIFCSMGLLCCEEDCRGPVPDIDGAYSNGRLANLIRLAPDIKARHRFDTPQCCANVCLRFAEFFGSNRSNDKRALELEQHYAELGLSQADKIPVTLELYLIEHLQSAVSRSRSNADVLWHRATLWAHAWHRIEIETIPNFNFDDDPPLMSVAPPPGVAGFAGMPSEAIGDLTKRAIYEQAIAQNTRKAEIHLTQLVLRRMTPRFIDELRHFFVGSFTSSQAGGVVGLLSVVQNPEKERIIRQVAEQTTN